MSCTHDCGCSPEIRDARTDEWVQIAPESARPATLTPEQPVKAPGQGGDSPSPSEPVLPRQIKPEDVRVGMLVERRNSETYVGGRVKSASGMYILTDAGTVAWSFSSSLLDSNYDQYVRAEKAEAEVERLTAERDALIAVGKRQAARLARVEALAEEWDGDDSCDNRTCVPHRSADALRAALAGSEADTSGAQTTDPGCGCSTNPARARYADGDPAGCYCTCSDDAREGCEHEPDEPQPTDQDAMGAGQWS